MTPKIIAAVDCLMQESHRITTEATARNISAITAYNLVHSFVPERKHRNRHAE